jgi:hypothetical protein
VAEGRVFLVLGLAFGAFHRFDSQVTEASADQSYLEERP